MKMPLLPPLPAGTLQNILSSMDEYAITYGKACTAAEREWWREIAQQLIDCHDEPTCPAVRLARDRLAGGGT